MRTRSLTLFVVCSVTLSAHAEMKLGTFTSSGKLLVSDTVNKELIHNSNFSTEDLERIKRQLEDQQRKIDAQAQAIEQLQRQPKQDQHSPRETQELQRSVEEQARQIEKLQRQPTQGEGQSRDTQELQRTVQQQERQIDSLERELERLSRTVDDLKRSR
ncbi:hypothetical protein [Pseudomonas sp. 5P_3.1_Bac2]|uniref:hypothetical protein n=1 Tax=Pseudomonas sp. 5P_3.1_Bac2 TaxID=2971617 RepID=UPI0021C8BFC8|nr:hypothetical protein [Pseudomonas sp. 5P_3.1_Bac2]MCU1718182.1 hypothetical protein [Pseudomonas sp. 5P_3.1_Bac2]